MLRGYLVVLLGIAAFFGVIAIGTLLPGKSEDKQIFAQLAFLVMGAGFVVGSIMIAVDKGYSAILGVLCGFFSPLGLLILTLLPNRLEKNVEAAES
ncbi:hypothetical protein [Gimesia panareensis]|uniref:Major facilitator superfamily (MFS) profile domain-containing protein n=1 Tax=Gimesia panareensis TaxID=2527978 RepID=A0A518FK73_9PLAN|nr:hypothetical protein [Gimesia panareensis]QDT27183.1 hypothetical protein Enr10x_24980 [Gimesia panareensis]QDU49967.1 hypothetical protein Pan110_23080 [Gimesia panareensis]QDV16749.1 hypothetical protein Pan153_13810 [Gimesia panareensis]